MVSLNGCSTPKVYADAEARQSAFRKATDHLLFTKDFNTALEAWRDDPLETPAARFMAWAKRTSWGRYSLYCVNEDGTPAYQVKAAEELRLDKRVISKTAIYCFKRGFLGMDGKVLYPIISPVPADNSFRSDPKSPPYATFLEEWKVAHATDFQEFEVAYAKVKSYQKVLIAGYKKWKTAPTNGRPSLLEEEEEVKEENDAPPPPFSPEPAPVKEEEEEDLVSQPITENATPTPRPPDLYEELKAAYPKHRFDESKAKPLFRALPRPVQQRALKRLRDVYLACDRWLDEGGKWIPWAHKWLNEAQYDSDPPPQWSKEQNRDRKELAPVDEVLALMRRNREVMP